MWAELNYVELTQTYHVDMSIVKNCSPTCRPFFLRNMYRSLQVGRGSVCGASSKSPASAYSNNSKCSI